MLDYIMKIFNFLCQGWIGSILGIIGILIAVVIYLISREKAVPMYSERSFSLLGQENKILPSTVEVFYNKKSIKKLSKTYLIFWNNGKKTLYGRDVVEAFPITIRFDKDVEILSTNIRRVQRFENQITISNDIKKVNQTILSFDFLDYKDGAAIEILHTGSAENPPKIEGTIRGIPDGIKHVIDLSKIGMVKPRLLLVIICFLLGIVSASLAFLGNKSITLTSVLASSVGFFAGIMSVLLIFRRKYPKTLRIEEIN